MFFACAAIWSFGAAMQNDTLYTHSVFFWYRVQLTGGMFLTLAWLFFIMQFTRALTRTSRSKLALFSIPYALVTLAIWIEGYYPYFWKANFTVTDFPSTAYITNYGPAQWAIAFIEGVYAVAALSLLISSFLKSRKSNTATPSLLLILCSLPISALQPLRILGTPTSSMVTISIYIYLFSSTLFLFTIFHYHLLNIVPIAFETLIKGMADAMLIFDQNGAALHLNPAAEKLMQINLRYAAGRPMQKALLHSPELLQTCLEDIYDHARQIILENRGEKLYFEATQFPFYNPSAVPAGKIVLLRNVTHRIRAEQTSQQSQDQLYRSEETYRQLVENIFEIVFTSNCDQEITYISPAVQEYTGYSPNEIIGECIEFFAPPEDREEIHLRHARVIQGESELYDLRLIHKNSKEIIFSVNCHRYFQNNICVGMQGIMTEVTEYRRTQMALERRASQLAILNEIGEQITAVIELDNILNSATTLIRARFGYHHVAFFVPDMNKQELVMRSASGDFVSVFPPQHRIKMGQGMVGWVAQQHQMLFANDVRQEEHYYNFFPEQIFTQSELAVPIMLYDELVGVLDVQSPRLNAFDNNDIRVMRTIAGQIAVAIGNARLYAQVREQLNERARLFNQLKERASELENANERLRELDHLKSQFLANMSHELRTPLNSIIGFSETLIDGVSGPLNEEQQEHMTYVYESGKHLLGLINDLLDFSKLEAGQMPLRYSTFSVAEVFLEAKITLSPLLEKKSQTLAVHIQDELPALYADRVRIRQVIYNLLGNANKFTPEGGHICISATQTDPTCLLLAVQDDGIGIRVEDQDFIFEEFRQVDGSVTREATGAGLGLSICKHILELHHGKIWVDSVYNSGSTFYISLPIPKEGNSGN